MLLILSHIKLQAGNAAALATIDAAKANAATRARHDAAPCVSTCNKVARELVNLAQWLNQ